MGIKVVAGDLTEGKWQFTGWFGQALMTRADQMSFKPQTVDLIADVDNLEVLTEEKVKKLAGTAGWGAAGALLLGPVGAIGGILLGGNKKQVAFAGYLHDGRKFMATTDSKTWQKIQAARF